MPSSSSSSMPGTRTASLHDPQISVSTSTNVPRGGTAGAGRPLPRVAEQAAQGAEVPAQSRERIVRFAEQQRDELASARGSIGAQQIGEQAPDLVSARVGRGLPVARDPRLSEQVDLEF